MRAIFQHELRGAFHGLAAYLFCAFLLVFVGVVTGAGGGLIRDVMAGNTPYIFVKHVYACASLAGALLCGLMRPVGEMPAMVAGAALVFVIRCLSAHYRWNLPRLRRE